MWGGTYYLPLGLDGHRAERLVSTAYQFEEAANRRFYFHGPEAITMKQALERYCRVVHPQIGSVSALPTWMANQLLGEPTITLDAWIKHQSESRAGRG